MTTTRAQLIQSAAIRIGGRIGSISSGQSTAAVLSGLIDNSNDDSMYVGWHLFMLDAANETDRERTVTEWDASAGIASWQDARTDTTYTSENYILVPDYSLDEFRRALNKALTQTKRTYRYVLPLISGVSNYSLERLTWLEGAEDVDAIYVSTSPNMLHNEDFEFWQNGSALAPDGWTLSGSGASVARSSSGIRSPYAVTVTRASADAILYQDVPLALVQYLCRSTNAPLPELSFGAWVTTTTATGAKVGLSNGGISPTQSSAAAGDGTPYFVESTYQTTDSDTIIRLQLRVNDIASSATFHSAVLCAISPLPDQLQDFGSQAYQEYEVQHRIRNIGGIPMVEVPARTGNGQLIVYSRRPFPEMSADTDVVEDQYADALVSGLLRWITDAEKPNQDRTRIAAIRSEEAAKWVRANKKFVSKPVQPPSSRVVIGGA